MKIVVIGAGTAASVSCALLLYKIPNCTVECIYDSTIPTVQVGESSTPFLGELLFHTLGISAFDLDEFNGTVKHGLKFINWSKKDFYHPFATTYGVHLNSQSFSEFILSKCLEKYGKRFTIKDQNVVNTDIIDADYIIKCTGFSSNNNDYYAPDFETVNSVLLRNLNDTTHEGYTTHYAHKHGWMFGIPLTNRKTYGFLYNNKVTSREEAIKEFDTIYQGETHREISWESKIRKIALDGRVLHNGNSLVFIEPLQAMSLHFYIENVNNLGNMILHNTFGSEEEYNKNYLNSVEEMLDVIAFHYYNMSGKDKDSKFWKKVKYQTEERSNKVLRWMSNPTKPTYSMFSSRDANYIYNGMN
jgi:tryptophan halogenase